MTAKKENNIYFTPEEGSLGLLAIGDLGLVAWRKKRNAKKKSQTTSQKNKQKDE